MKKASTAEDKLRRQVWLWKGRAGAYRKARDEWEARWRRTEQQRAEVAHEVTSLWFWRIAHKRKLQEWANGIDATIAKGLNTRSRPREK